MDVRLSSAWTRDGESYIEIQRTSIGVDLRTGTSKSAWNISAPLDTSDTGMLLLCLQHAPVTMGFDVLLLKQTSVFDVCYVE